MLDPKTPILCFSTTDWHETWGSRQQLMLRMAKRGHPVLFIERQVGPEQLWRDSMLRARKLNAWKISPLRQVLESLWIWQPPLLPPGRYYSPLLNKLGQHFLARKVHEVQAKLKFSKPLLWVYPPQSAPLVGKFGELLSIYHCIENFSGNQPGIKRQVMQLEEHQLLRRVDLVFVHSAGLLQRYKEFTRRAITLIPSAADVSHFQSSPSVDPIISEIPHPRLGIAGTLDGRLDQTLLLNLAHNHLDWHLVLIGRYHPERVDLKNLLSLPNVHFIGHQPFEKLPQLLNGLDIFLIPYVLNEMTVYISPIKLYEYLAVGKPIVSTNLPEVTKIAPLVRIAYTAQEFSTHIQEALLSDTPDQVNERRTFALQHSWDVRLDQMLRRIEETLKEENEQAR